jgi:hypothetical protein
MQGKQLSMTMRTGKFVIRQWTLVLRPLGMHIILFLYHRTPQHGQYLSIRFVTESISNRDWLFALCEGWNIWKICWYSSNSGGWSKSTITWLWHKASHFVLRQLFSSQAEFNVREVSTAWSSCSHIPAAYVTYILSSGRIVIRPCQRSKNIKYVMMHCPYISITFWGFFEHIKPPWQAQQIGQHGGRQDSSMKTGTRQRISV